MTLWHFGGATRWHFAGEDQFVPLLDEYQLALGPQRRSRVLEAAAVAVYRSQREFPVVKLLISDDAPQYSVMICLPRGQIVTEACHGTLIYV